MPLPPRGPGVNGGGGGGGAAPPLVSLAETLKCPHCNQIYVDPVLLDCTHSICLKCARDLAREGGPQGFGTVSCPTCKRVTSVPGVDEARHMEGGLVANALRRFNISVAPTNPRIEVNTYYYYYYLIHSHAITTLPNHDKSHTAATISRCSLWRS